MNLSFEFQSIAVWMYVYMLIRLQSDSSFINLQGRDSQEKKTSRKSSWKTSRKISRKTSWKCIIFGPCESGLKSQY